MSQTNKQKSLSSSNEAQFCQCKLHVMKVHILTLKSTIQDQLLSNQSNGCFYINHSSLLECAQKGPILCGFGDTSQMPVSQNHHSVFPGFYDY